MHWFIAALKKLFGVSSSSTSPSEAAQAPSVPVATTPGPKITVTWINAADTGLAQADAARIIEALNLQVPHLAQFWPTATNITHTLLATDAVVPTGSATLIKAYFLPNADVAGALGYHDVDPQGDAYIRVFTETVLQNGGSALSGPLSISCCASHEGCEEAVDPSCVSTYTTPSGDVWAAETADPVQNNSYNVTVADGTAVALSDFVTPAFFGQANPGDSPSSTTFDYLGVLTKGFSIASGGYAVINNQQVMGEKYVDKGQGKDFPAARTYKRLHRVK